MHRQRDWRGNIVRGHLQLEGGPRAWTQLVCSTNSSAVALLGAHRATAAASCQKAVQCLGPGRQYHQLPAVEASAVGAAVLSLCSA
jgi:hypothetical protein